VNPVLVAAGVRHRRKLRAPILVVLCLFAPCACGALFVLGSPGAGVSSLMEQAAAATCKAATPPGEQVGEWNPEQTGNAAAIVAEGQRRGLPSRAFVVALATAMQESRLLNLDHGDRDSLGLFQQRPSQGWGTPAQIMDPTYAAGKFYDRLAAIPGWESMPLWQAAQSVQASGFPMAYEKWEQPSTELVARLGVVPSTGGGCGGAVIGGFALPLPPGKIVPPLGPHHDYPAVDIPVPVGTPVYAIVGGTVRAVDEPAGCGTGVAVIDAAGNEWMYCHGTMRSVAGGIVNAGDPILVSGSSGSSTGPHLHVQLRRGGGLVCPQPILDALALGQPAPAVESLPSSGCFR
jgi:murein DD-endopeptidase MepM/ murein hydrolase activator NlpD